MENFFSPPSGPATGSFNGLHLKSNFPGIASDLAPEIFPESREISGFSERGEKCVRYITGAANLPLSRMR